MSFERPSPVNGRGSEIACWRWSGRLAAGAIEEFIADGAQQEEAEVEVAEVSRNVWRRKSSSRVADDGAVGIVDDAVAVESTNLMSPGCAGWINPSPLYSFRHRLRSGRVARRSSKFYEVSDREADCGIDTLP